MGNHELLKEWIQSFQVMPPPLSMACGLLYRNTARQMNCLPQLQSDRVCYYTHIVVHSNYIEMFTRMELQPGMLWFWNLPVVCLNGTTHGPSICRLFCGMVCSGLELMNAKRFIQQHWYFFDMFIKQMLMTFLWWHFLSSRNVTKRKPMLSLVHHGNMRLRCIRHNVAWMTNTHMIVSVPEFPIQWDRSCCNQSAASSTDPHLIYKRRFQHYHSNVTLKTNKFPLLVCFTKRLPYALVQMSYWLLYQNCVRAHKLGMPCAIRPQVCQTHIDKPSLPFVNYSLFAPALFGPWSLGMNLVVRFILLSLKFRLRVWLTARHVVCPCYGWWCGRIIVC